MIWGKVVSFTDRGAAVGQRIAALLPDDTIECYARGVDGRCKGTKLTRMVQQAMVDCSLLIFVGATGIAVRSIAPYLQGKAYDPAVLVVDENARFVISLVSGHLGGANALAAAAWQTAWARRRSSRRRPTAAACLRSIPGRGSTAVRCSRPKNIQYVSAALLRGDTVGCKTDFAVRARCRDTLRSIATAARAALRSISAETESQPFPHTLHLVPRIVHIGIGCRRGTPEEAIEAAVQQALDKATYIRRRCVPWRPLT